MVLRRNIELGVGYANPVNARLDKFQLFVLLGKNILGDRQLDTTVGGGCAPSRFDGRAQKILGHQVHQGAPQRAAIEGQRATNDINRALSFKNVPIRAAISSAVSWPSVFVS